MVKEEVKKLPYDKLNLKTGLVEPAYEVRRESAIQDQDGNWRRVVEREEIILTEKRRRDALPKIDDE